MCQEVQHNAGAIWQFSNSIGKVKHEFELGASMTVACIIKNQGNPEFPKSFTWCGKAVKQPIVAYPSISVFLDSIRETKKVVNTLCRKCSMNIRQVFLVHETVLK